MLVVIPSFLFVFLLRFWPDPFRAFCSRPWMCVCSSEEEPTYVLDRSSNKKRAGCVVCVVCGAKTSEWQSVPGVAEALVLSLPVHLPPSPALYPLGATSVASFVTVRATSCSGGSDFPPACCRGARDAVIGAGIAIPDPGIVAHFFPVRHTQPVGANKVGRALAIPAVHPLLGPDRRRAILSPARRLGFGRRRDRG